ncbi:MAG: oxidoreductase [Gilvibacter sp.]
MKKLFLLFALCGIFSCADDTDFVPFNTVSIHNVYADSVSIRAITAVNDSTVWFAGSGGKVGVIEGKTPKLATIRYQENALSFRAIAKTEEAVFVLSIANPGVLYKIGVNGSEATYIEEVYVEEGEKVFYDAMKFWNDQEGLAIGDPIDGCFSLLITRDGGDSWSKTPCDDLPAVEEGEAFFAASNTNIAVIGNEAWVVSGGKKARVFKTSDKGKTWSATDTPIIEGAAMTGIYTVAFRDAKNGIVFGGNWDDKTSNKGNKAITTDGGKSWKLLSDGSGPGYKSCVVYVPNSGGEGLVAVGSTGISHSPDGGLTWATLSSEGYYAIEFVNDSIAFASGLNKIDKLRFK